MRVILLFLFLCFSLQADDVLTKLFAQLKTVSSEDKFKVVNKIKKHIVALKQEERLNAIKILKAKKEAMQKEEMKKSTSEMPSKMTDAMDKEPNEQMEMGKNQPKEGEMPKKMEEMNSKNMPLNMNQMMPKNSNMGNMENTPLMQAIRIDNQRLNEPLKIGANLPLFHDSAHFYCQIDKNVCSFPTYHAHCHCVLI